MAKPNALGADKAAFGTLAPTQLISGQLVWALQTIGAFPLRDDPAPMIVYVLWLIPFLGLIGTGFWNSRPRPRAAALLLLAIWIVVPVALTIVSYGSEGLAWQGRYALPLAVGFPALAGLALNARARGPRRTTIATTVILCASAQAISVAHVASVESGNGLAPTFAAHFPAAVALIATLSLAGAMIPLLLFRGAQARSGRLGLRIDPVPVQSQVL